MRWPLGPSRHDSLCDCHYWDILGYEMSSATTGTPQWSDRLSLKTMTGSMTGYDPHEKLMTGFAQLHPLRLHLTRLLKQLHLIHLHLTQLHLTRRHDAQLHLIERIFFDSNVLSWYNLLISILLDYVLPITCYQHKTSMTTSHLAAFRSIASYSSSTSYSSPPFCPMTSWAIASYSATSHPTRALAVVPWVPCLGPRAVGLGLGLWA